MEVSVIIPVYNAARYVRQAVQSALAEPETGEVILIEDGSSDNSLMICQSLAENNTAVCLLRHPGGVNRGAGASRNLGMINSQYDYIAFLDADDYFLPGRFVVAKGIFMSDYECGGVYEAIGTHIQDEASQLRWEKSQEMGGELITMTKIVPPEDLLKNLIMGGAGYFSPIGLVFKRELLSLTGLMNEKLRLHQDNDFIYRLAAVAKLLPGKLTEPVAVRRIHQHNRITAPRSTNQKFKDRFKMWKETYRWFRKNADQWQTNLISTRIMSFWMRYYGKQIAASNEIRREINKRIFLICLLLHMPELIFDPVYWITISPSRIRMKFK